jgi:hypothetical protein
VGRLLRAVRRFLVVGVLLWGVGQLLARRSTEGDADSDEFSLAAIFGGAERTSTATALRRGRVLAVCGGVQLDLREAALDPGGAELHVEVTCGGVQVLVPATWRVTDEVEPRAGGVDVRVAPADELADDAPSLTVRGVARMGGVQITTEGSGSRKTGEPAPTGA